MKKCLIILGLICLTKICAAQDTLRTNVLTLELKGVAEEKVLHKEVKKLISSGWKLKTVTAAVDSGQATSVWKFEKRNNIIRYQSNEIMSID